jgi:3-hydroxyacyl-[acyl-carrier-protein] dehydratase
MQFSVPHDHPCLPGHFPGRPLVPGVLLLEQVLQAAIAAGCPAAGALSLPQVKFLHPLLPGQVAEVVLEGAAPRWRFEVRSAGQVLVRGELQVATDV